MTKTEEIIRLLEGHFGRKIITTADKLPVMRRRPSGSFGLDIEIGGGLPQSAIVEIYGRRAVGKTALAMRMIALNQQLYDATCVWIDVENRLNAQETLGRMLGVDWEKLIVVRPMYAEEALDAVDGFIRRRGADIVVLDSLGALNSMDDIDKSMQETGRVGGLSKAVNRLMRRVVSALQPQDIEDEDTYNWCTFVCLNHLYDRITAFGSGGEVTTGGRGKDYMALVQVKLIDGGALTDKFEGHKVLVGKKVKFVVDKNSTYADKREGFWNFYTMGQLTFDHLEELIRYGLECGIIERRGSIYLWQGEKVKGMQALRDLVSKHWPVILREIFKCRGLTTAYEIHFEGQTLVDQPHPAEMFEQDMGNGP